MAFLLIGASVLDPKINTCTYIIIIAEHSRGKFLCLVFTKENLRIRKKMTM